MHDHHLEKHVLAELPRSGVTYDNDDYHTPVDDDAVEAKQSELKRTNALRRQQKASADAQE